MVGNKKSVLQVLVNFLWCTYLLIWSTVRWNNYFGTWTQCWRTFIEPNAHSHLMNPFSSTISTRSVFLLIAYSYSNVLDVILAVFSTCNWGFQLEHRDWAIFSIWVLLWCSCLLTRLLTSAKWRLYSWWLRFDKPLQPFLGFSATVVRVFFTKLPCQ